jgi:hypothetical protein
MEVRTDNQPVIVPDVISLRKMKMTRYKRQHGPALTVALVAALSVAAVRSAAAEEACTLTVRSASGASVGRIEASGTFRSSSGSTIGRFKEGTVRDRAGSTIGRVDDDGTIRNRSGARLGRVERDGTLRGSSGARVGRIEPDGTVRNASGARAGRFEGYVPACRHAAAAYLFFFEPLHNR